jgi:hypothetical protein
MWSLEDALYETQIGRLLILLEADYHSNHLYRYAIKYAE